MNTAAVVWTFWLITYGMGQGATPVVTPLATYPSAAECYSAIDQTVAGLKKEWAPQAAPTPGVMICVGGSPARK